MIFNGTKEITTKRVLLRKIQSDDYIVAYKEDAKTPIKKVKKAYVIGGGNVAMDNKTNVNCEKLININIDSNH